ncbi:MAG: GAF domain-containing sensor histidine kinase [Chloroflexi bacterium]|nr:GAF domain-containing sensor histidine kinase [Chloroflexota bacterium]
MGASEQGQRFPLGAARVVIANPIVFFYLFRWLTWLLAAALVYTKTTPLANLHFQPGLLMYAALQLFLGLLYTAVLRPRLDRTWQELDLERPQPDLLALSVADMAGSLAVLFWSGGLGTPLYHYVVTSVLMPCFLYPNRWGLALAALFGAGYVGAAAMAGELLEGAVGLGQGGFRGQATRDVASMFFIAAAVVYLGQLFRSLQAERRRTKEALDETAMLFSLTQDLVRGGTELQPLFTRLTQVMRGAGAFDQWALLLKRPNGRLEMTSSTVGVEEIDAGLAEEALRAGRTLARSGSVKEGWQVAVPLKIGEESLGVMVAGSSAKGAGEKVWPLAEAVAGQIAIGLQNALLAVQKADLAAQEERSRIAREIHDGIAQAIYMLSLHLETCAELAAQGRQDLPQRLGELVGLSKQALLEVRHYIFDLKPYLAGEQSAAAMVSSQVSEFAKVSGVSASFDVQGEQRPLSVSAATCLYRVTQEALANVFRHAQASGVQVTLEFLPSEARLDVADNGMGFDPAQVDGGNGLDNMQHRAQELGGSFRLRSSPGHGTEVSIALPC